MVHGGQGYRYTGLMLTNQYFIKVARHSIFLERVAASLSRLKMCVFIDNAKFNHNPATL